MTEPVYRQPPRNLEAEQALLGAILLNNGAHDRVSDFLEEHHFFDHLHQQIYETASKLIVSGKRVDPITLKTFFEAAEPIDASLTVPQYLVQLAANATTIINARDYGRTIHNLAVRRGLILVGEDIVNTAYDSPVDFPPNQQIEEAETRLYGLVERSERGREITFSDVAAAAAKSVRDAHLGKSVGLPTGFPDVDAKMGGLQPSDLIILAARPSMGKSTLGVNIANNVAAKGTPVGFFSLEMSDGQIGTRIICARAGVPVDRAMRGQLEAEELRRFEEAATIDLPLYIDQTGGISIAQLAARARRLKRRRGIGLLVVDYLQLMTGMSKRGDNRVQEVTEITTGLKALAKELNVPIIALSQLNRDLEKRVDKRPQLSDLRESGSIEQDADIVLFLYREEYYLERERPSLDRPAELADWTAKMAPVAGKAEVIIGKQRHGPIGSVLLFYDGPCMQFSNLARGGQAPNGAGGCG